MPLRCISPASPPHLRCISLDLPSGSGATEGGSRLFLRLVEAESTGDEVMRCLMVLIDAILDPAAVPKASDRVALHAAFDLARVLATVISRCQTEYASEIAVYS